ncbi:MAG: NADAR family protein [Streptomyces sp.]|nr:NADAR family protein [Streptomyces sp.]
MIASGAEPQWRLFFGHRTRSTGAVDEACLSQWWPASFRIGGITYPTAEHWMMAAKARLFGDDDAWARVVSAADPAEAKRAGRKVRGFDEATWAAVRFGLVVAGNYAKFMQNPQLRAFLVSTAREVLVEASPYDRVWGTGVAAAHRDARDPSAWPGLNLLGFALMRVRDRITAVSDA